MKTGCIQSKSASSGFMPILWGDTPIWLYNIKVIISDCLSEDLGSIPNRVAHSTICSSSGLGHRPFTAATGVQISYRSLCGKPDVEGFYCGAHTVLSLVVHHYPTALYRYGGIGRHRGLKILW